MADDARFCTSCGAPAAPAQQPVRVTHNIIVNNVGFGKKKDKWLAFFLCLFLGVFGVHKFYEERIGMGILYLFTAGLFGIGWLVDIILLLCKPNPYYVL